MTLYIQAASPRARKPISAHEPSAYRTSHSDNFHIHDHSRDAFPHVINSLSMWRPTSCKRAVHICYTHHLQPGSSPVFPPISHSCAFSGVLRGLLFRMHTHLFMLDIRGNMVTYVSSGTQPKNMKYFLHSLNSQVFPSSPAFVFRVLLQWLSIPGRCLTEPSFYTHIKLVWLIPRVFFGIQ